MSRSKIKAVAPFLLRVWEKQLKKKYRARRDWPEFKEFWDDHCGVAGHAWEKVTEEVEECFDCGQQRGEEPHPRPLIDDEFYGCPEDVPEPVVKVEKAPPKKSLLARINQKLFRNKR